MTDLDADIICLQETKLAFSSRLALSAHLTGYSHSFTDAAIGGQSGTAIYERDTSFLDILSFGSTSDRLIGYEYDDFIVLSTYFPACGRNNCKLQRRLDWYLIFQDVITSLRRSKPVIVCGDLNIRCDNQKAFKDLLDLGFVDAYSYKHPNSKAVSIGTKESGTRLDYFLVDTRLQDKIVDSCIRDDIKASDHYPIILDINL